MNKNQQIFKKHLAQTSNSPLGLEISSAKGLFLYDKEGKSYLDAIAGISVSVLGHQHPKIKEALINQIDKHLHVMVYGELVQSPQLAFVQRLVQTLPNHISNCFLVNSGSEAVEGALKLAKRYTKKSKIFYCKNAYHGSSHGALSVTGNESLKRNFRPLLPNTHAIRYGNIEDIEDITPDTAAVIIETVQGEAGVRLASKSYFQALRKKCTSSNALLILDEIQCGVGRTGKFWAFEHYDIIPDILLTAKGLGGGLPLGAFISSLEIMSCLTIDPILGHISTFGGHPLSCASANATLEVINQENIIAEIPQKHDLFVALLSQEKAIKEIRGIGLLMAWFLFCDTAIRLAPPLNISLDEIRQCCALISKCIHTAKNPVQQEDSSSSLQY